MRAVLACLSLALAVAACGGGGTGPPVVVEPTFDSIQRNVFHRSCSSSSCHSELSHKGNLVLTADRAYADLLCRVPDNGVARCDKGCRLVIPGDVERSFIMHKLVGPETGEGKPMPDVVGGKLSEQRIEAVREWIRRGAPMGGDPDGGVPAPACDTAPPPKCPPPP